MRIILSLFFFLAFLLAAVFFYFLKPINLGITYTEKDLKSSYSKLNVKFEPIPVDLIKKGKTLIVSGAHLVDSSFTSQELTALIDNRYKQYVYFPFRNVQIRVNSDGTVEGSATVNYNDAVNYLVALGVSYQDIVRAAAKFKVPKIDIPVYLRASGSVINNLGNINIQQAKIANIPVPQNLINEYGPKVNDLIEMVIRDRQPSYNIEILKIVDGKIYFKGTSPDVEQAATTL